MMQTYDVCINVEGKQVTVFSCLCPFEGPDSPFLPFGYCNVLCKKLYGEIDNVACDNEKCVARTQKDAFGNTCGHGYSHHRKSACGEQCPRCPESRCM